MLEMWSIQSGSKSQQLIYPFLWKPQVPQGTLGGTQPESIWGHFMSVSTLAAVVRLEMKCRVLVWILVLYGFQDKTREFGDLDQ